MFFMLAREVEVGGNTAMLGRVVVCASGGRNDVAAGGAGGCGG